MKNFPAYRLIASLLALSILIGVSMPAGLYASAMDLCDMMEDDIMNAGHSMPDTYMAMTPHDSCPMEDHQEQRRQSHHTCDESMHSESHDPGFDCDCGVEEASVKTEAPLVHKTKTHILNVVQVLPDFHVETKESVNHAFLISDTYSQPPIFLVNESFLM